MIPDARTSALVVAVPEAEALVGTLRAELDPAAAEGVPAHVTILFPFVPPPDIDDGVLAAVAEVAAAVPAFAVALPSVAWFDDRVVWLAPEPAAPFVVLTRAVQTRFGLAPYRGKHGSVVTPHLTVGVDAPVERLRAAASALAPGLPVRATVDTLSLLVDGPGRWRTAATFPLGAGPRG